MKRFISIVIATIIGVGVALLGVTPAHAATVKVFHRTESVVPGIRVYPNASCAGGTYATVSRNASVSGVGSILVGKAYQLTIVKGLQPRRYNLNGPTWSQSNKYDCVYVGGQSSPTVQGYAVFRR